VKERVGLNRYASALREHLRRDAEEQSLLHAYELGRELMEDGVGLLDVVRLHTDALAELPAIEDSGTRRRAGGFLAEVLAPFEMAYLGFTEANKSLQRLTASLEAQVAARTAELQDTLSALQAADAERRRLLARVTTAQEEERRRIAGDLHDDSIQAMTAVSLRLSTLRRLVGECQQGVVDRLERSVSESISRLRRLLFELRPPVLDQEGLGAAIRLYLKTALADGPAHRVDDRLERQPPLRTREIVYRITQEALTNVRKHAQADRVTVTLVPHQGGTLVTITDDGAGFDVNQLDVSRPGHLGATAMRERAALAGGWCTFDSAPGRGATVRFWIPDRTAHPHEMDTGQ
jgi:signal transduction histidine kinase